MKIITNSPLCVGDVFSYNISEGQALIIEEVLKNNTYISSILSKNNNELLNDNYINGVKCYYLYNILGGSRSEAVSGIIKPTRIHNTKEFTIINIQK